MNFNSKGQLSTLILSTLKNKDMYGLEIISEVESNSDGDIIIKQPSLYSNLKRMEQQGYISSYWKDSELGGRRHYYSITDLGRKACDELLSSINVSKEKVKEYVEGKSDLSELPPNSKPVLLQQENIFSVLKEQGKDDAVELSPDESYTNNIKELKLNEQYSIFNDEIKPEEEKIFSNAMPKPISTSYENIDIVKEFKNYKRRKSFAENQIKIEVPNKKEKDLSSKQQDINIIKDAIEEKDFIWQPQNITNKEEPKNDDAILITDIPDPNFIPKVRKLQPAQLNIYESQDTLPPPIKNIDIEPTYKDMVDKLYEKSNKEYDESTDYFDDYKELERHYSEKGVIFKEYKKAENPIIYPTNKLNLIKSGINFLASTLICLIVFFTLNAFKLTNINTNFIYFLVPAYFLVDIGYNLYKFKYMDSRPFNKLYNPLYLILFTLILSGAIIGVNLLCGMKFTEILSYASTFILPFCLILIVFVDYLNSYFIRKFKN